MSRIRKNTPPHLAEQEFDIATERYIMHCKIIVSGMAAVRNDGVGEDTSKGKDYTFSVYTFTEE